VTLEAAAGKNAVSHVGKLYSVMAWELANTIVAECDGVAGAEVFVVSRIGAPINEPRLAHVHLRTREGSLDDWSRRDVEGRVHAALDALPSLTARVLRSEVALF
jgi:S-adenosylmethionine synthetase